MAYMVKQAHALREVWDLQQQYPGAYLVAGGTDIIPRVNQGLESHPLFICLEGIDELRGITQTDDCIRIGALTKLVELTEAPELAGYAAVLRAASRVASPQIRNQATLGGNLLQENRCIYFNQSVSWRRIDHCFKLGGDRCYQYKGSPQCVALFQSDMAPVMLAHGASLLFAGPEGERELPLAELYLEAGRKAKQPEEILLAVRLPKRPGALHSAYVRETIRGSIDFPLVSCATVVYSEGGVITQAGMAIGSAGVKPAVMDASALIGKGLSDLSAQVEALKAAGRKLVMPFHDLRVDATARKALGESVIERAVLETERAACV